MTSHIEEVYLLEFKRLFNSQEAKEASSVLYVFSCKKKIPRVKGESNIIYIGKTRLSLQWRYGSYWKVRYWSHPNLEFVSHVIKHYGPVSLAYLVMDTPEALKETESDLLKDYYELHMELPPKNAQGYGSWGGDIQD
jgi:hypothetical protein